MNYELFKKEIEEFEIEDLADIIRSQPLIAGKNSILAYNKKQREELKNCMLEIAKRTLDLTELEGKFLEENIKNYDTNEKDKAEIKDLLKNHLDKKTYNLLKDLL